MAWREMDFIPVKFIKSNPADNKVSETPRCSYNDNKDTENGESVKAFYDELVGLESETTEYNKNICKGNGRSTLHDEGKSISLPLLDEGKSTSLSLHGKGKSTSLSLHGKGKSTSLSLHGKGKSTSLSLHGKGKSTSLPSRGERKSSTSKRFQKSASRSPVNTSMFLKAAQEGEAEAILSMLRKGIDIDSVDNYGWTALMCAAHAGHEHIVKLLMTHGASKDVTDNHDYTAEDLARKMQHKNIVQMLEGVNHDSYLTGKSKKLKKPFFCDICQTSFSDMDEKAHQTSTIHLFNMKLDPKPLRYQITEANPGFKMMLRSGWNQEAGLGAKSQGQMFPVKTVLKRDRKGLGCKSDTTAKVTHFTANDTEAVKKVKTHHGREMKVSTSSKKAMKRSRRLEKRKEMNFRREFYLD